MKLHVFLEDEFHDVVPTERTAWQVLARTPIDADCTYLAVPWCALINEGRLHDAPDIRLNGGATVCQHVEYRRLFPILRDIGIDTLFTPHVSEEHSELRVLPFPIFAANGALPAPRKDIFCSFIGANTGEHLPGRVRSRIFELPPRPDVVIKYRDAWHWRGRGSGEEWLRRHKESADEFRSVLSRSRFSLCPRGNGPSTIRFWESLQAGAIPVLLSDEMRLPEELDWNSCTIRLPEDSVESVFSVLEGVSPSREQELREGSLHAYARFSGENFASTIHHHYSSSIR